VRLSQIFELLETVVLPTGFSIEAADENAVATFAYRIMLNVRGLQGIRTIRDS
jgi:hypothetical protein